MRAGLGRVPEAAASPAGDNKGPGRGESATQLGGVLSVGHIQVQRLASEPRAPWVACAGGSPQLVLGTPLRFLGASVLAHPSSFSVGHTCGGGRDRSLWSRCHGLALAFSLLTLTLFGDFVACLACGQVWATSVHLRGGLLTLNPGGRWLGLGPFPPRKALTFSAPLPGALHSLRGWGWGLLPLVSWPFACIHHVGCGVKDSVRCLVWSALLRVGAWVRLTLAGG